MIVDIANTGSNLLLANMEQGDISVDVPNGSTWEPWENVDFSGIKQFQQVFNLTDNSTSHDPDLSAMWNASGGLDLDLIHKFERNRKVEGLSLAGIVAVYGAIIAMGAAGNSLVVLAVVRKPAMRTARNVFIINLAISDLVLCLATTPLTLVELLTQYWPLGDTPFLCKLVGTLQATTIFVSTISITAIALDRYQVILHPTKQPLSNVGALLTLPVIWIAALFLAVPQFLFRQLDHHDIHLPGVPFVNYCYENWPVEHGRAYYSVFVMLIQFLLPLLTVSASYARIVHKLRYRMVSSSTKKKSRKVNNRNRKTNVLLMTIALIFCLSWLPFHVFNIVMDYSNPFGDNNMQWIAVFAVCHILGMSSACSNPILYGWLNDNFRKEFKEILRWVLPCKPKPREDLSFTSSPCTRTMVLAREIPSEEEGEDDVLRCSVDNNDHPYLASENLEHGDHLVSCKDSNGCQLTVIALQNKPGFGLIPDTTAV